MDAFTSLDQCGFPVLCCEKHFEEQAASTESGVEEIGGDKFGQVSGL